MANISAPKTITFGIINQSTVFFPPNYKFPGSPSTKVLTDAQAKTIASAIAFQLQKQFAPLWPSLPVANCIFVPSNQLGIFNDPNIWPVVIIDTSPTGATAEHSMQGDLRMQLYPIVPGLPSIPGRPMAYVTSSYIIEGFGPCDGQVYFDPFINVPSHFCPTSGLIDFSIASGVSHEAMEMLSDGDVLTAVACPPFKFCFRFPSFYDEDVPETNEGAVFVATTAMREAADQVQSDSYPVTANNTQVYVSNFPTQAWFNTSYWLHLHPDTVWQDLPGGMVPGPLAPPSGTKWDYMGLLTGPWEVNVDGYFFYNIISTSGSGPLINPPNWQNPAVTPLCAESAPSLPPSYKRVALNVPDFGIGSSIAVVFAAHMQGHPSIPTRLKRMARHAGVPVIRPDQVFYGAMPYFKRNP